MGSRISRLFRSIILSDLQGPEPIAAIKPKKALLLALFDGYFFEFRFEFIESRILSGVDRDFGGRDSAKNR